MEGLEDALNVDRDSFNRFHPQFKEIQKYLHGILQSEVFSQVYRQIDVRSREKASDKAASRDRALRTTMESVSDRPVRMTTAKATIKGRAEDTEASHVEISRSRDSLEITLPSPDDVKVKKANRQLATSILAIYELSQQKEGRKLQRETFERLLLELLNKW